MAARRELCEAITFSQGGRRFTCTMPKGHSSRGHWWVADGERDDAQLTIDDALAELDLRCEECSRLVRASDELGLTAGAWCPSCGEGAALRAVEA